VNGPTSGASASIANDDSISYTPPANFNGNDTIIYSICDDGIPSLCDTDTVFITVTPVNDAPNAVTDFVTLSEDTANAFIDVQVNDTDPEGDALTTTIVNGPTSGATASVTNDDSISYTPPANFNGNDTIIYSICDDGLPVLCDTDTVFITVTPVNDAPNAVTDFVTLSEDTANAFIDVQVNDTDPEGDALTTTIVSGPTSGATASVANGDSISYTPPANFNGNDTIIYSICDNGLPVLCDTDTIFIFVINSSVNSSPIAENDTMSASDTTTLVIDVLNNDFDPDGDSLTVNILNGPTGGTGTVTGNGSIIYIPDSGVCGLDSITYIVCDPYGACDTAVVYITVSPSDTDGDGIPNFIEGTVDIDSDSLGNFEDLDSDGDGIPDSTEAGDTSDPCNIKLNDTDNDGIPDYLDLDSDGDGKPDADEYDSDNNGITDDCNDDGIPDWLDPNACIVDISIPEGFSPNGDGLNETFIIEGLDAYPGNTIYIFNRWGNKVFSASPYHNDWDGTSDSDRFTGRGALPVGTYFYVLELKDGQKRSGFVYLTR
jgi:gliding motility-associated-like protein